MKRVRQTFPGVPAGFAFFSVAESAHGSMYLVVQSIHT